MFYRMFCAIMTRKCIVLELTGLTFDTLFSDVVRGSETRFFAQLHFAMLIYAVHMFNFLQSWSS